MADLYNAAIHGRTDEVKRLLKGGVDVNWQNKGGDTPLYVAAYGHTETIKLLLAGGAKVDLADNNGITPLYVAAQKGHTEAIKALLAGGAKVDLATKGGATPLYYAAYNGHTQAINVLLAAGATVTTVIKGDAQAMAFLQPFLTAQASSSMGKLTVSSSASAASICFSARTSQIPFVEKVVAALKVNGISSYYQNDISKIGPEWDSQWMKAADGAKKIVCILTADYPASEPCCDEFSVAKDDGKLVVVYKDNIAAIKAAPANDFNGKVKIYVKKNGQGLNPDVAEIVAELKKVL